MYSRMLRVSLFSFQNNLPYIESGQQAQYYFYSNKQTYPYQYESQLSIMGKVGCRIASSSSQSPSGISILGSTRGVSVSILLYQSMSPLLHLEEIINSGCLRVDFFQPPSEVSGVLCIYFLKLH